MFQKLVNQNRHKFIPESPMAGGVIEIGVIADLLLELYLHPH